MVAAFRAASAGYGSTNGSLNVPKPTGTAAGDLMVALVVANQGTNQSPGSGGWTRLTPGGLGEAFSIFYKIAEAADPGSFVFNTGGGEYAVCTLASYSGVVTANPIQAFATATGSLSAPSVTTAGPGQVVLSMFEDWGSTSWPFNGTPAGTTLRAGVDGGSIRRAHTGLFDAVEPQAGPTPARTLTTGVDFRTMAYTLALSIPNTAPNAPTLTSMAAGEVIDRAAANRATHTFSDPDGGDTQSAFDHRYRLVGAATWTTAYQATPNLYVDYAAGTFAAGDYERQVRTYDAQGVVGPWSASGFFTAADAPATPTITAPINNAVVSASASVTWSAPNQDAYQLQVMDGGVVEYDTGTVADSAARTRTAVPFPQNNTTRQVRVRVRANGLWSTWYSVAVSVSFTPPAAPVVALAPSGTALVVQVTNPVPSGGQPPVIENRVYVDDGLDDGETLRARVAANASWSYWTPRSGIDYDGRVRVVAVGDNGTEATSA